VVRWFAVARITLACCLAALAPVGAGELEDLLRALREQLAAGRYEEALALARRGRDLAPGDPGFWYNLAGLEEYAGQRAAAVSALRRAVALGFDDFRHADADSDLGGLRRDAAYAELRAGWAAGLATRARARATRLVAATWSEPQDLPDRSGGLDPPRATARFRATADALEVELAVDDAAITPAPPWQGGSGVFATVLLPEADGAAEGRHHAEFAFGLAEGVPAGALRLGDRWQRLAELVPKLRRDPATGETRLSFAIPWSVCASLHPLVDDVLGVNLTYVRRRADAAPAVAAWIADPAAGRADRPWRRGVPLRVEWPPAAGPAVRGRIADLVVRSDELALRPLAAVAADQRSVEIRAVVRDRDGRLAGEGAWALTGSAGRRTRAGELRVTLPAGSVRLGLSLEVPGAAAVATWEENLVEIPPGWEAGLSARIAAAPARERPSLEARRQAILAELATRHPLADPAALGATVDELEVLLARVAATGTSLPAGGPYLAVFPGADGGPELRCSLALPDGWRRGDPVRALLLLAQAPGGEQRAAMMTPRLLAERSRDRTGGAPAVVVAVPHWPLGLAAEPALAAAERLLAAVREFLDCGPVHVAGVDLLAATALELAAAQRADLAGILLVTGLDFTPYPGEGPDALAARVRDIDPTLPAGWFWFPDEQGPADQAAALRRALTDGGLELAPAQAVAGGLDFDQAWSRAVLWAAGLLP